MEEQTYRIVRFLQGIGKRIIKTGVSLKQAQEHCQDKETQGEGWFDGYERED